MAGQTAHGIVGLLQRQLCSRGKPKQRHAFGDRTISLDLGTAGSNVYRRMAGLPYLFERSNVVITRFKPAACDVCGSGNVLCIYHIVIPYLFAGLLLVFTIRRDCYVPANASSCSIPRPWIKTARAAGVTAKNSRSMRVLFISLSFYPAMHYGGPTFINRDFCKSLAKHQEIHLEVLTT